jgi:GMP synthase-like glutamine amidotransferase
MRLRSVACALTFAAAPVAQQAPTAPTAPPPTERPSTVLPSPGPIAGLDLGADPAQNGWTFEPIGWARDVGRKRVLRVGPEGDAAMAAGDAAGVVLRGTSPTARGDLVSRGFALGPLRWVDVEVEYRHLEGEAALFVGLRPVADRRQVDLESVPVRGGKARSGRAAVRLHSGLAEGPYALSLSIAGRGAVQIRSVSASIAGAYRAPTRPLCVIDIRTTEDTAGPNPNFARVASVFGFPSVEYLHYTRYERAALDRIDPALIVLPGLISLKGADSAKIDAVVRDAVRFDAPVVGVCLGHQVLARAHGASLRKGEREWGPTRIDVVRKDPLFAGLPRGRGFFASQSHRFEVREPVGKMQRIASSDTCRNQVFRYRGKPWYTFQGHIERGWEVASPEACLLWKNMLRGWRLIPR